MPLAKKKPMQAPAKKPAPAPLEDEEDLDMAAEEISEDVDLQGDDMGEVSLDEAVMEPGPLDEIDDDSLLAEIKKRGLMAQLSNKPAEDNEEEISEESYI